MTADITLLTAIYIITMYKNLAGQGQHGTRMQTTRDELQSRSQGGNGQDGEPGSASSEAL